MPRARNTEKADLDALIERATVDFYNDSEARTGFYEALRMELKFPFTARVLGEQVMVHDLDLSREGVVEVICHRGKKVHRVAMLSLDVPPETPKVEWLLAYRKFCRSL